MIVQVKPVETTYFSADVIARMEALGFTDAMVAIGDEVLGLDLIAKPDLLALLTSAGLSIPGKAQLLKYLNKPTSMLEVRQPSLVFLNRYVHVGDV